MRFQNPDGSYDILETTPENTQKVLASEPLYAADTDDPNFMAPDETRDSSNGRRSTPTG